MVYNLDILINELGLDEPCFRLVLIQSVEWLIPLQSLESLLLALLTDGKMGLMVYWP